MAINGHIYIAIHDLDIIYCSELDDKVVEKKMSDFTEESIYGPDPEMYTHLTDHVFQMILGTGPKQSDQDEPTKKKLKEV